MADILELAINHPQIVALAYSEGREYPSKIDGAPPQVMFTFEDQRRAFWPKPFAESLKAAGVQAHMPIEVCKREIAKGKTQLQFRILAAVPAAVAAPPAPPAPAYTPAAPVVNEIYRAPVQPAQPPVQPIAAQAAPLPTLSGRLLSTMCCLIDCMAEAKLYAQRKGIDLTNEDLRCLVTSSYINESKGGR